MRSIEEMEKVLFDVMSDVVHQNGKSLVGFEDVPKILQEFVSQGARIELGDVVFAAPRSQYRVHIPAIRSAIHAGFENGEACPTTLISEIAEFFHLVIDEAKGELEQIPNCTESPRLGIHFVDGNQPLCDSLNIRIWDIDADKAYRAIEGIISALVGNLYPGMTISPCDSGEIFIEWRET